MAALNQSISIDNKLITVGPLATYNCNKSRPSDTYSIQWRHSSSPLACCPLLPSAALGSNWQPDSENGFSGMLCLLVGCQTSRVGFPVTSSWQPVPPQSRRESAPSFGILINCWEYLALCRWFFRMVRGKRGFLPQISDWMYFNNNSIEKGENSKATKLRERRKRKRERQGESLGFSLHLYLWTMSCKFH